MDEFQSGLGVAKAVEKTRHAVETELDFEELQVVEEVPGLLIGSDQVQGATLIMK